jgi:hypothetical protein
LVLFGRQLTAGLTPNGDGVIDTSSHVTYGDLYFPIAIEGNG